MYNRIDLSPDDDFVCPVFFKDGMFHFMPDNNKVKKELSKFIKSNQGKFGLLKIKIQALETKKIVDN